MPSPATLARRHLAPLLALLVVLAPAPAARAAEPDYSGLQALLKQYVRLLPATKGQPWDSRFDYEQLFIDEKVWGTGRADRLATLHAQLLAVSPESFTPRERTAWAINTYNLLVIERMTLNLLVPRRKFQRRDSPKEVHDESGSFFGAAVARIGARDYSISGFERRFVYGDTAADPAGDGAMARETPGDPRLMFALHKAALCSGPVIPWVYRADSLEAQLDRAARLALALPRTLRTDAAAGTLDASNRFFEERADFGGPNTPGLLPFALKYGPAPMKKLIQSRHLMRVSQFFEPDWQLDQFQHPAPRLPGAADPESTQKR